MITLIVGGSGSGKSTFGEAYIQNLAAGHRKYYIATMQVYDQGGQEKVARHREQRRGKGFQTIEIPRNIEKAVEQMSDETDRMALLECISNLTANEMFTETDIVDSDTVVDTVVSGIRALYEQVEHLVIISNNVFEDGISYDASTMAYLEAMGRINRELAVMADEVIEVVVGIPVMLKSKSVTGDEAGKYRGDSQ